MRQKSIFLLATLLFLLPLTAHSKVKLTKLKLSTAKQIKIPKQIIADEFSFKKDAVEKFEDSSFGAYIKYADSNHPAIVVSYYIYPMNEGLPLQNMVPFHYENIKSQIIQANKTKGNRAVLLTESLEQVGGQEVFYNKHNIVGDSIDMISETYLTHNQFHYLKIRISFPRYKATEYVELSAKLADALIGNTSVKEKRNTGVAIVLNAENVNEMSKSALIMQLAYLSSIKASANEGNLIFSFDQIYNTLDLVATVSKELSENNEKNHDLVYFDELKTAGYMDEFIWTYMQQPHWIKPNDMDLSAFKKWFTPSAEKINPISPKFGYLAIQFD